MPCHVKSRTIVQQAKGGKCHGDSLIVEMSHIIRILSLIFDFYLHSGVGRLVFEMVSLGYRVQGNEFSLHMLLASDFLLNSGMCDPENPLTISPWLLESRNLHSSSDAMR